jgi:hypothetical protein
LIFLRHTIHCAPLYVRFGFLVFAAFAAQDMLQYNCPLLLCLKSLANLRLDFPQNPHGIVILQLPLFLCLDCVEHDEEQYVFRPCLILDCTSPFRFLMGMEHPAQINGTRSDDLNDFRKSLVIVSYC